MYIIHFFKQRSETGLNLEFEWNGGFIIISNRILDASVLIGCNSTNMNDDDMSMDNNKNKT
jgi:hypothetical protein